MFKDSKVFSSFSTDDIEKAKEFYGKTLGIEIKEMKNMGIIELHFEGGTQVMIYPKEDHAPATFTVLNFIVEDIEESIERLTGLGIEFEQYDFGDFKTDEKGIMKDPDGSSMAWFKDPAGNVLSILQTDKETN